MSINSQKEIVRKLRDTVLLVDSEERIVYVLVQTRKLIELHEYGNRTDMQVLKSLCSWPLHTRMDRADASGFLQLANLAFEQADREGGGVRDVFTETILWKFRTLLINIWDEHGILIHCLLDLKSWMQFASLYARAISDSPLVYQPKAMEDLRFDEAILTGSEPDASKSPPLPFGQVYIYDLQWTLYLNGTEQLRWHVPLIFEDYDLVHNPENRNQS